MRYVILKRNDNHSIAFVEYHYMHEEENYENKNEVTFYYLNKEPQKGAKTSS